ncbi:hypothetical protein Tsubulata_001207, partial [Turnera subulata]
KMVRAPCCEKMGLKRGPWTHQEDQILISYIQKHGHSNWRALPKQAGTGEKVLMTVRYSLVLYRWSAIAAKLPGRTDNEIKNVWHTHLKKRLKQKHGQKMANSGIPPHSGIKNPRCEPPVLSPQPSSTDNSSVTDPSNYIPTAETSSTVDSIKAENIDVPETLPVIDQDFWFEPELVENSSLSSSSAAFFDELQSHIPVTYGAMSDDGMDFWYNIFIKSGGIEEKI